MNLPEPMHQFHLFTLGAIAMILGYIIFMYFHFRQKEYLYFAFYLFFVILNIEGAYYFAFHYDSKSHKILYHISFTTFAVCAFIANFLFMQQLLDLKKYFAGLNKIVNLIIIFLLVYVLVDLFYCLFFYKFKMRIHSFNILKVMLILFTIPASIMIMKKSGLHAKYFVTGLILFVIMGAGNTLVHIFKNSIEFKTGSILSIVFFRTGVIAQILFFAMGVSIKMKQMLRDKTTSELRLVKELYEKELEKHQAVTDERRRISADLHDDIGSGLSKIALLSELIKRESKKQQVLEGNNKISTILKGMSGSLNEIIWTLNSKNDCLENLVAYMRHYAAEYFENSAIRIKINIPSEIPPVTVTTEQRRNIFFVMKEALHNIVKHAGATEVEVNFNIYDNKLLVTIHDNGKGFNNENGGSNRFGNGMENMRSRMNSISGTFAIENHHGTKVIIELPV